MSIVTEYEFEVVPHKVTWEQIGTGRWPSVAIGDEIFLIKVTEKHPLGNRTGIFVYAYVHKETAEAIAERWRAGSFEEDRWDARIFDSNIFPDYNVVSGREAV